MGQSQESVTDQLNYLKAYLAIDTFDGIPVSDLFLIADLAECKGLYDAADHVNELARQANLKAIKELKSDGH